MEIACASAPNGFSSDSVVRDTEFYENWFLFGFVLVVSVLCYCVLSTYISIFKTVAISTINGFEFYPFLFLFDAAALLFLEGSGN